MIIATTAMLDTLRPLGLDYSYQTQIALSIPNDISPAKRLTAF